MKDITKVTLISAALLVAPSGAAVADGRYETYLANGDYFGLLEIQGDVADDDGRQWAYLVIDDVKLMFYVDPNGVYVTLDPNNPIIARQTPFQGAWMSTASDAELGSNVCPTAEEDHMGNERKLWGEIVWTNTGLNDTTGISFKIDTNVCGGPMEQWLVHTGVASSHGEVQQPQGPRQAADTGNFPAGDLDLCARVNAYRAEHGLPAVPISPALMAVARAHVEDAPSHFAQDRPGCNFHSWSDNPPHWGGCCYTDDHAQAQCMWDKPREITASWPTPFTGNGYENGSGGWPDNAGAVEGWKSSPAHNAVMLNQGIWSESAWQSIGCGSAPGSYFYLWFSDTVDPNTP